MAIQTVRSLNGLFSLQSYSSITDINQEEKMQLWDAIKVNSCNLVEIPLSVLDLSVLGENRVFNSMELLNPLNLKIMGRKKN